MKKLGIGSPSQSTFRFFILGPVKSAGLDRKQASFDIFWVSLEVWAVSGLVKKLGIGSPSQSTFRFFIWGPVKCWVRQRTGKFG